MKRLPFLLSMSVLLSLLMIFSFSQQSYAQEPTASVPDSTTIPEEVLAQIDLADGERVLRVFDKVSVLYYMGQADSSIEKIMQAVISSEVVEEYYLVMTSDTIVRTYTDGGELGVQPSDAETADDIIRFFWELPAELEDFAIIRRVSEDIVVNNIYVLSESYDLYSHGWIIYYDTDHGPYVYYDSYSYTCYLMPLEVFRQLAKEYIATDIPDKPSPSVQLIENYEEKYGRYDLNSNRFYLNPSAPGILWVLVAIVPIAAALGIGWYAKKRKSRKEGEV